MGSRALYVLSSRALMFFEIELDQRCHADWKHQPLILDDADEIYFQNSLIWLENEESMLVIMNHFHFNHSA